MGWTEDENEMFDRVTTDPQTRSPITVILLRHPQQGNAVKTMGIDWFVGTAKRANCKSDPLGCPRCALRHAINQVG